MKHSKRPFRAKASYALAAIIAGAAPALVHADSVGPVKSVYAFAGGDDGAVPYGQPIQGPDGDLYGTTSTTNGGCCGGIYKVRTDGTNFTILHTFSGGTDGAKPMSGLTLGADGNFYGVTTGDGAQGQASNGTVFKMTSDGTLTILHTFNYNDGYAPNGPLAQGPDGTLYGTTLFGGLDGSGDGTVFRVNPDGTGFATLYAFGAFEGYVQSGIILGQDGRLYGTTENGGYYGSGSVFALATDGSGYTLLHAFDTGTGDGTQPNTALVQGPDGTLYGTVQYGGSSTCLPPTGCGAVFRVNSDGTGFATLHTFEAGVDGSDPINSLIFGANGNLYSGNFNGVVYELQTDGTFVGAYSLDQYDQFANQNFISPSSALTLASDGLMYGVTFNGGANLDGTIYSIDPGNLGLYPVAEVTLSASRHLVKAGRAVDLSWTTGNATACTAAGAWSGDEPVTGTAQVRPPKTGRYLYKLSCVNANNLPTTATALVIAK